MGSNRSLLAQRRSITPNGRHTGWVQNWRYILRRRTVQSTLRRAFVCHLHTDFLVRDYAMLLGKKAYSRYPPGVLRAVRGGCARQSLLLCPSLLLQQLPHLRRGCWSPAPPLARRQRVVLLCLHGDCGASPLHRCVTVPCRGTCAQDHGWLGLHQLRLASSRGLPGGCIHSIPTWAGRPLQTGTGSPAAGHQEQVWDGPRC